MPFLQDKIHQKRNIHNSDLQVLISLYEGGENMKKSISTMLIICILLAALASVAYASTLKNTWNFSVASGYGYSNGPTASYPSGMFTAVYSSINKYASGENGPYARVMEYQDWWPDDWDAQYYFTSSAFTKVTYLDNPQFLHYLRINNNGTGTLTGTVKTYDN